MLTDLVHRLRALFARNAVEHEIDEELRFHFEQNIEQYILLIAVPLFVAIGLAASALAALRVVKADPATILRVE
jgi:hypothetical protein